MLTPHSILPDLVPLFPEGIVEMARVGVYDPGLLAEVAGGKEPPSRQKFSRFLSKIRRAKERLIRPMILRRLILMEMLYCNRSLLRASILAGFVEMTLQELDKMDHDQRAVVAARKEATRLARNVRNREYRKRRKARTPVVAPASAPPASPAPELAAAGLGADSTGGSAGGV